MKLLLSLVASLLSVTALAQEPAVTNTPSSEIPAVVSEPALSNPIGGNDAIQPLTTEDALVLLNRLKDNVQAKINENKGASLEQRKKLQKQLNQFAAESGDIADEITTMASRLAPEKYIMAGLIVTWGRELQIGRSPSRWSVGGGAELGGGFFVKANAMPAVTGIGMGAGFVEWTPDINTIQNRSLTDEGFHFKAVFTKFWDNVPVSLHDLEGAYFGVGLDQAQGAAYKIYVGGCANSDLRAKEGQTPSDIPLVGGLLDWVRGQANNCNSVLVTRAVGKNPQAPPVSFVGKAVYLKVFADNYGRGFNPFDGWFE